MILSNIFQQHGALHCLFAATELLVYFMNGNLPTPNYSHMLLLSLLLAVIFNKKLSCHRQTVQCFVSLNISQSHSSSFNLTPLCRAHLCSYLYTSVTMSLPQRIRGFTTMCYINQLFTYLLTYSYRCRCIKHQIMALH